MTARTEARGSVTRQGLLLVTLGVLAVLLALAPRSVHGEKALNECIDDTWPGYNDCLVEAGGWIERKICDLAWQLEVASCVADKIGEIRHAFAGGGAGGGGGGAH